MRRLKLTEACQQRFIKALSSHCRVDYGLRFCQPCRQRMGTGVGQYRRFQLAKRVELFAFCFPRRTCLQGRSPRARVGVSRVFRKCTGLALLPQGALILSPIDQHGAV